MFARADPLTVDSPHFKSTYQVRDEVACSCCPTVFIYVSSEERPAPPVRVCTANIVPIHWTELNACMYYRLVPPFLLAGHIVVNNDLCLFSISILYWATKWTFVVLLANGLWYCTRISFWENRTCEGGCARCDGAVMEYSRGLSQFPK